MTCSATSVHNTLSDRGCLYTGQHLKCHSALSDTATQLPAQLAWCKLTLPVNSSIAKATQTCSLAEPAHPLLVWYPGKPRLILWCEQYLLRQAQVDTAPQQGGTLTLSPAQLLLQHPRLLLRHLLLQALLLLRRLPQPWATWHLPPHGRGWGCHEPPAPPRP